MPTVGVIVNPLAGKDIRRLVGHASPVSDVAKVGAVRRAVAGVAEAGAARLLVAGDRHRLGERALDGLDVGALHVEVVDAHVTGRREDTLVAAVEFAKRSADVVLVFGGDGTHRDVAAAWPDATLVAVSTGTNNVFPMAWDATAAGLAAGLVATGTVPRTEVSSPAKLLRLRVECGAGSVDDVALVEVAHVEGAFVGSRAVWDPDRVRAVVAAIATPSGTGLSGIVGRVHPVGRDDRFAIAAHVGLGGRRVRVPLMPGSFHDVGISSTWRVDEGDTVSLDGPGVLALDGERSHVMTANDRALVWLDLHGPAVIDVDRALRRAAELGCFDVSCATEVAGAD